jgi:arsenate reductase
LRGAGWGGPAERLGCGVLQFYYKPSCGACKKAKAYLDRRGLDYELIDITRTPPPRALLERAIDPRDPKKSLNARSSSFRNRELGGREMTAQDVLALLIQDPNLIKRPFFVDGDHVLQGFDAQALESFLG